MKTGNLAFRRFQLAVVLTISLFAVAAILFTQTVSKQRGGNDKKLAPISTLDTKQLQIDLDKATAFDLPDAKNDLTAVSFKTPDGKEGWVMRIPGSRPIATPAYADGMIFVGGGYGSHEFYAIDAETGRVVWQMQTKDDGPTAAVVEDGYVAFKTESCTVIVADAKTGKVIWQEWLGDPLMSQPAISNGLRAGDNHRSPDITLTLYRSFGENSKEIDRLSDRVFVSNDVAPIFVGANQEHRITIDLRQVFDLNAEDSYTLRFKVKGFEPGNDCRFYFSPTVRPDRSDSGEAKNAEAKTMPVYKTQLALWPALGVMGALVFFSLYRRRARK